MVHSYYYVECVFDSFEEVAVWKYSRVLSSSFQVWQSVCSNNKRTTNVWWWFKVLSADLKTTFAKRCWTRTASRSSSRRRHSAPSPPRQPRHLQAMIQGRRRLRPRRPLPLGQDTPPCTPRRKRPRRQPQPPLIIQGKNIGTSNETFWRPKSYIFFIFHFRYTVSVRKFGFWRQVKRVACLKWVLRWKEGKSKVSVEIWQLRMSSIIWEMEMLKCHLLHSQQMTDRMAPPLLYVGWNLFFFTFNNPSSSDQNPIHPCKRALNGSFETPTWNE